MKWIDRRALIALHDEAIARFGGAEGLREAGGLDAALDRPRTLHGYEPDANEARLAAAYAAGIIRNHPFVDGNKRTALFAMAVFLEVNGRRFDADQVDLFHVLNELAASALSEDDLARWLRDRVR